MTVTRVPACTTKGNSPIRQPTDARFWKFVAFPITPKGNLSWAKCWEWTGTRLLRGYGRFALRHNVKVVAHRYAYEYFRGPIRSGLWCLHNCDNPPCCNPLHLFLGTHLDNMADMRRKDRHPGAALGRKRQDWNPYSKLTEDDVRVAREAYTLGTPQAHIATCLDVHPAHISRVVRGRSWRHVA